MHDHYYAPRRNWDTGEAPYTIRQSGHLSGCAKCGGSPLAHRGPGGWPWWTIIITILSAATIAVIVMRAIH